MGFIVEAEVSHDVVLEPPPNFSMVEQGIYRSSFPRPCNFAFNLGSIIIGKIEAIACDVPPAKEATKAFTSQGTFGLATSVIAVAWCTSAYGTTFVSGFTPILSIFTGIIEWLILGDDICLRSILGGFINIISIFIIFWGTHATTATVILATIVPATIVAPASTSVPESQPDLDTTVDATILNVLDYQDVSKDESIELITDAKYMIKLTRILSLLYQTTHMWRLNHL
ncbi:hypothetical protein GQ457_07G003680 [Hibiscus cannabinus]